VSMLVRLELDIVLWYRSVLIVISECSHGLCSRRVSFLQLTSTQTVYVGSRDDQRTHRRRREQPLVELERPY